MAKGKYKYWLTEDGLILLRGWARDGLTDEVIAKNKIGISKTTLYEWKNKYSEFADALKKTKEIVDCEVEDSLYKRATGFFVEEELKEKKFDANDKLIETHIRKTKKYFPPDSLACAMWLNNRKSKSWRRNAGKEKLDEEKFEHEIEIDSKKYW